MNNDVVVEILLHLPVRSLLRFRAVCKFWCDVIGSPRFRKLHSGRRADDNDKDDTVYLQLAFLDNSRKWKVSKNNGKLKVSVELLDNGKSLKSHDLLAFKNLVRVVDVVRVVGAVKGLICISSSFAKLPISICNPFLGQFKILPVFPSFSSHSEWYHHEVGVGFDEDYKVLQLLSCSECRCLHANLYSRRTNSWKELAFGPELDVVKPIKSLSKNGSFAHWEGWRRSWEWDEVSILSFDMKNEVFRRIIISGEVYRHVLCSHGHKFIAKDGCSFLFFVSLYNGIHVFESRGEGSELEWNHVTNVERACYEIMPIWRSDDRVVFKNCDCVVLTRFSAENEVVLYDYRARRFIGRVELPANSHIVEYEGSFISP